MCMCIVLVTLSWHHTRLQSCGTSQIWMCSVGVLVQFRVESLRAFLLMFWDYCSWRFLCISLQRWVMARFSQQTPELGWWLWGVSSTILTLILSFQRLNVLPTSDSSLDSSVWLVCGEANMHCVDTHTSKHTQSLPAAFTFVKLYVWREWDSQCNKQNFIFFLKQKQKYFELKLHVCYCSLVFETQNPSFILHLYYTCIYALKSKQYQILMQNPWTRRQTWVTHIKWKTVHMIFYYFFQIVFKDHSDSFR